MGQSYLVGYPEMKIEKNLLKAIPYLKKSAELGNPDALTSLGEIFRYGEGELPMNKEIMMNCFESAVECGSGRSAYILGDIYFNGRYFLFIIVMM